MSGLRRPRRVALAAAALALCWVPGRLHSPDEFAREWRHYRALRARDAVAASPRPRRLDYRRTLALAGLGDGAAYAARLQIASGDMDAFGRGDAALIRGRLLDDRGVVCASLDWFARSLADAPDDIARAVVHETLFAVGRECGHDVPDELAAAAALWDELGVHWRADEERRLLHGDHAPATLAALPAAPALERAPRDATTATVGAAAIVVTPATRVVAQAERVSRDWLRGVLGAPWRRDPALDYFEGALVAALAPIAAPVTLYGAFVRKIGAHWYAPDEHGRFRFLVLDDKVERYPTTRFLADDVAVLVDVHGVSALAALAMARGADVVIGCCDYFDKVFAAEYLAARGIAVACPADRFLGYALGARTAAPIVGGGRVRVDGGRAVIGGVPVRVRRDEPIVVEDTDEPYPEQYADAPARYFALLGSRLGFAVDATLVSHRRGLRRLLDVARERGAAIVAVRIQTDGDGAHLAAWLDQDARRRALLFHSAPYAAGRSILERYGSRVTAPDARPVFE